MNARTWVRSGIVEECDERQERLLALVLSAIQAYYAGGNAVTQRALSLAKLMRLTKRNGLAVTLAVKILANTTSEGERVPAIWYERVPSVRHPAKRYYRITLR